MTKSSKGSSFEREISTKLSLWWTKGKRDDVFWRTSGSGARATTRSKNRRRTSGQYGDICAIDPIGETLTDVFTIELKRGYNSCSLMDLVDRGPSTKVKQFEKWINKAIGTYLDAGSASWVLIARRDRRTAMVYMPLWIAQELSDKWFSSDPVIQMRSGWTEIFGGTFENFLANVTRQDIVRLSEAL